ncbi:MAG: DUF308 domain-containing protein [Xanthobacteraceae bacterium]
MLSIAFGAVLIAWPGTGALAVIWTIAWFAVFLGCMFVGLAFELKKFNEPNAHVTREKSGFIG